MKEAAEIMLGREETLPLHPMDHLFRGLRLDEMTPLQPSSQEFLHLAIYLHGSRGSTHGTRYQIQQIFRIERRDEKEDLSRYVTTGASDRRLLWHGSRSINFGGILSQGLRIAPPEAPSTGACMFGKGIYLADMSSKSARYCASQTSNADALLLLCEAQLGINKHELHHASSTACEDAARLGKTSTFGKGTTRPASWTDAGVVHRNLKGVLMPDIAYGYAQHHKHSHGLYYNEYICYDPKQVKLRYLFRVSIT